MASRLLCRPDQVFFVRTAARMHPKFIKIVNQRLISWDKGCACVLIGSAKPVAVIRSPKQGDDRERAFDLNFTPAATAI
jgi:hypothetical protein